MRDGEVDARMLAPESDCKTAGVASEEDFVEIGEWGSPDKFGRYGGVRMSEWTYLFVCLFLYT